MQNGSSKRAIWLCLKKDQQAYEKIVKKISSEEMLIMFKTEDVEEIEVRSKSDFCGAIDDIKSLSEVIVFSISDGKMPSGEDLVEFFPCLQAEAQKDEQPVRSTEEQVGFVDADINHPKNGKSRKKSVNQEINKNPPIKKKTNKIMVLRLPSISYLEDARLINMEMTAERERTKSHKEEERKSKTSQQHDEAYREQGQREPDPESSQGELTDAEQANGISVVATQQLMKDVSRLEPKVVVSERHENNFGVNNYNQRPGSGLTLDQFSITSLIVLESHKNVSIDCHNMMRKHDGENAENGKNFIKKQRKTSSVDKYKNK